MHFQERRSGRDRRAMPALTQSLHDVVRVHLRRDPADLFDREQADWIIAQRAGDVAAAINAAFELGRLAREDRR